MGDENAHGACRGTQSAAEPRSLELGQRRLVLLHREELLGRHMLLPKRAAGNRDRGRSRAQPQPALFASGGGLRRARRRIGRAVRKRYARNRRGAPDSRRRLRRLRLVALGGGDSARALQNLRPAQKTRANRALGACGIPRQTDCLRCHRRVRGTFRENQKGLPANARYRAAQLPRPKLWERWTR